jgi:hypothetical protein
MNARPSRIALILASMAAFIAGISMPVYGEAIDYGVFRKRGG